jgi:hypothetical protein
MKWWCYTLFCEHAKLGRFMSESSTAPEILSLYTLGCLLRVCRGTCTELSPGSSTISDAFCRFDRRVGMGASAGVGAVYRDPVPRLATLWICAVLFVILPSRVLREVSFGGRGDDARGCDTCSEAEASAIPGSGLRPNIRTSLACSSLLTPQASQVRCCASSSFWVSGIFIGGSFLHRF